MRDMVQNDDTLMAVYPKIRGVPDQQKKVHYKKELTKVVVANKECDVARKNSSMQNHLTEKAHYNADLQRLIKKDHDEKD